MKSSDIVVGHDYMYRRDQPDGSKGKERRVRVVGKGAKRQVQEMENKWGVLRPAEDDNGNPVTRESKRNDGVTIVFCNYDGTIIMADKVRPKMAVVPARWIRSTWKGFYSARLHEATVDLAEVVDDNRREAAALEIASLLKRLGIPVECSGPSIYTNKETVEWHAGLDSPEFPQDGRHFDWNRRRYEKAEKAWQEHHANYNNESHGEVL